MKNRFIFLFFVTSTLCSCASYFTRKDCESKNWFDYGYQVAMSGKRLNSDNYLAECRKVEAAIQESQLDLGFKSGMSNYCKPEVVFASGKKGLFFNNEFCDPGQVKMLTVKHAEGVNVFCEPSSGYTFGSSGGMYNQICPKEKEEGFMKEYRKGRKKYLSASIVENQNRIQKLNADIQTSNMRKMTLENDLKIIEAIQIVRPQAANANANQVDPTEEKKRDLRSKINQSSAEINGLNANRTKLQEAIYSMEKEILTLD
jgi:hypothetical protein